MKRAQLINNALAALHNELGDDAQAKQTLRRLLGHHLQQPLSHLLAFPDEQVSPRAQALFEAGVARLINGEPLAYLLGWVPFLHWNFKVDHRALIPRPETEALTAEIISAAKNHPPQRILDLCCGGGAIGLSLALAFPNAEVTLTDICNQALTLARENRDHHRLQARVRLYQGDLLAALPNDRARFDLVVANPPYVAEDDTIDTAVDRFEPHLALFSPNQGMGHVQTILKGLAKHLAKPHGWAAFELGHYHQQLLPAWLDRQALPFKYHWREDPFGVTRFLWLQRHDNPDKIA